MEPGKLNILATPIGNLDDLTFRALRIMKETDIFAAEDTRVSRKLLNAYQIKARVHSYHEHNKAEKGPYLIEKILQGLNITLLSDAGTPCISDPGKDLVSLARQAGIKIESYPGACACITALTLSGMPAGKFTFEGFLSKNNKERRETLDILSRELRTIVMYESPHHLLETLKDLYDALGDRNISISKELTKRYEHTYQFTLSEAVNYFTDEQPKGEFVLVIEGANKKELQAEDNKKWDALTLPEHMDIYLSRGMTKKEAMKQVATDRGIPKRDVYQALLKES